MGQASGRNEAVKILELWGRDLGIATLLWYLYIVFGQTCYVGVLVVSYGRKWERFQEDFKGRGPRNG